MAFNMKVLSTIAGSLLAVAFIFFVVSNAVPEWSKYGGEGYEYTFGIWKTCTTVLNLGKQCPELKCPQEGATTNSCSKILAARAFVTLTCIISGIAALLLFGSAATSDSTKQILLMAGKGLAFASLIMGIIGVAIGINVTTEFGVGIKLNLGAAAIIGIIAIILNFVGAVASVLIK